MPIVVRQQGLLDYATAYARMRAFTAARTADTPDELWLCQHPPVYTQGQAGQPEHVLAADRIPVIATDRGGQVTYHGPGQVVAYPLIDLRRAGYFVKELVWRIEEAVLQVLRSYRLQGQRVPGAPGIYVPLQHAAGHAEPSPLQSQAPLPSNQPSNPFADLGKIAALGLKVHRHGSYHGVALNVDMDLEPFSRIHPCGYCGLPVIDLAACGVQTTCEEAAERLAQALMQQLTPNA
ncbi:MAG: lipoyl(octanoyl) transferase LipB [Brachymonas sp.]|nr:lipoyl(octanoyl) transferase LipB [Brachymonas sp.]